MLVCKTDIFELLYCTILARDYKPYHEQFNTEQGLHWMDGWITCDFTSFSKGISVILGQCKDDNERLCAIETSLRWKDFFDSSGTQIRDR